MRIVCHLVAPSASDPSRNAPFVSDVSSLVMQVNAIAGAGGGTALYDAIVTGLYRFRGVEGRRALVIITDGEDTTSRLSYDDMLTYARAARVPLYFIGIGMGLAGGTMKSLAAETGGFAVMINNVNKLPEAYKKLQADLRSQYLLAYRAESSKTDDRPSPRAADGVSGTYREYGRTNARRKAMEGSSQQAPPSLFSHSPRVQLRLVLQVVLFVLEPFRGRGAGPRHLWSVR